MACHYAYHLGLAHRVITNGHPYGLGLDDQVTLAQQLKNGGYSTHAIGICANNKILHTIQINVVFRKVGLGNAQLGVHTHLSWI